MHIILSGNHPRPSSVVPAVPAAVDAITMRALSRNPSNRYETARQMAVALEQATQLATSTTVGEWVGAQAEPQLAERARIMREIDARRGARGDDKAGQDPPLAAEDVVFEPSMVRRYGSMAETLPHGRTTPAPAQRKPWLYAGAGALGVALISVTLIAKTSVDKDRFPETSPATVASSTPVATSTSPVSSNATSAASAVPAPSDSAPLAASTVPSATGRPRIATPTVPAGAPRAHAGARVTPAAKGAKPECNPPYTVDEIGVRHYKPECSM
jgi:serine/threonine-protein kinase